MFPPRFLTCLGALAAVFAVCLALGLPGCSKTEQVATVDPVDPEEIEVSEKVPVPKIRFTDVTAKAGIRFTHTNGAFVKKLLPETMGSGVAFLDFDNDGHQDLLFVNSCYWPGFEEKDRPPPTLALYRNKGDGTFEDVTAACGVAVTMYGMGVTVGAYDNDG